MAATPSHESRLLNPKVFSLLPAESYHGMLQESVHHFLSQIQAGSSDFSHFNLIFFRLIQSMTSPPIEIIWFYSAVNFQSCKNCNVSSDQMSVVSALKELFQLLVSCSASCGGLKRVAVLAPLIYELYIFVSELKVGNGLSLDRVVKEEIDSLVEGIVGFSSMCCWEGVNEHDESLALSVCFVDLVKVWTFRRRGVGFEFEDDFRLFFPLISDEGRSGIHLGSGVGYLAGVVMCETLLLNLCLKFALGKERKELEEDVRNLAVNIKNGFQSCYFFDILLKMLLEPSLPVTSLLNSVDERFIRHALFDATILVDYPFFNLQSGFHLCGHHLKSLALTWVVVANTAILFVRENGDETKAITYIRAFSESPIPSQVQRWVSNQLGTPEDANGLNLTTPTAFIEWIRGQKIEVSTTVDYHISLLLDKESHYRSQTKHELPLSEPQKNSEGYANSIVSRVQTSPGWYRDPDFRGCQKRKVVDKVPEEIRVKFPKYDFHDHPIKKVENKVENSVPDEDMEIMVQ